MNPSKWVRMAPMMITTPVLKRLIKFNILTELQITECSKETMYVAMIQEGRGASLVQLARETKLMCHVAFGPNVCCIDRMPSNYVKLLHEHAAVEDFGHLSGI